MLPLCLYIYFVNGMNRKKKRTLKRDLQRLDYSNKQKKSPNLPILFLIFSNIILLKTF